MKNITIVVCLCVALLPSYILGNDLLKIELDRMAETGETIKGILRPSRNGYLGPGAVGGFAYKGTLLFPTNIQVAMKLSPRDEGRALSEYAIYTCLDAINRTEVEAYGIPSVRYYGSWGKYILLAIPFFDSSFDEKLDEHSSHPLTETDILIVCREFVRITKYIHSYGIYHHDLHLGNIMFREDRVFIIDYNSAETYNKNGIKKTKKDWKTFVKHLRNATEKYNIEGCGLRRVFSEFSKSISDDQKTPNYNKLYKIINRQIKKIHGDETVFVSWLADEEMQMAVCKSTQNPLPPIDSINEPPDEFGDIPIIDYKYFDGYNWGGKGPSISQARTSNPHRYHGDNVDLDLRL